VSLHGATVQLYQRGAGRRPMDDPAFVLN
jgi:hypothetical protein